jgi:hypothetical protein
MLRLEIAMDVLVLLPELPYPADTVPRLRACSLLTMLNRAGFHPHLVAFRGPGQWERHESAARCMAASVTICPRPMLATARGLFSLLRGRSATAARADAHAIHEAAEQVITDHHCKIGVALGAELARHLPRRMSFKVLDLGERPSAVLAARAAARGPLLGHFARRESELLGALEHQQIERADLTLIADEAQAAALTRRFVRRRIVPAPIEFAHDEAAWRSIADVIKAATFDAAVPFAKASA